MGVAKRFSEIEKATVLIIKWLYRDLSTFDSYYMITPTHPSWP